MLLEYVERAMTELDEAQRRLSVLKGDVFGRLRLSAPVAYAHRVVAPHLPAFERANPEVRVELVASNRFANLLEGQVDASIRVARRLADSRLRARRIGEHRLWTVAASSIGNWLPDDFDDERLRTLPGACFRLGLTGEVEPWRFRIGTVERELLPERRTIMDDNASMVAWAVAMGGVTQVPSYAAADDVAAGRLMRIWPDREQSAASVYIVYPEHNRDNPALKAFVQFFKTVLVSSAA